MKRTRQITTARVLGLCSLAVSTILGGCQRTGRPGASAAADSAAADSALAVAAADRPECPQHDSIRVVIGRTLTTVSRLAVPGNITNIPEFHDCQRFINSDGQTYGPLVAIYAAQDLDSLFTPPGAGQQSITAAGLIYSYDGEYRPLEIKQYFNCLYLIPDAAQPSGFRAYIYGVGSNEALCAEAINPAAPPGVPLQVRKKARSPRLMDYPPVARWDWDAGRKEQYIGIACGAAWCSITSKASALNESPDYDDDTPPMTDVNRVRRIKGWYDEQRLAINGTVGLTPEDPVGTVIPDPVLYTRNKVSDFDHRWVRVAEVSFTGFPAGYPYGSKFGFTESNLGMGRLNRVSMCHGLAKDCLGAAPIPANCTDGADAWWARIQPAASASKTTYRCVVRHDHSTLGVNIPATARWRWLLDDETLWVRCAQGCCTVTGEK